MSSHEKRWTTSLGSRMLSFLYFMKFCSVISGSSTTGIRFLDVQISMATSTILVFSCSLQIWGPENVHQLCWCSDCRQLRCICAEMSAHPDRWQRVTSRLPVLTVSAVLTTALAKFLVWLLERRSCTNCRETKMHRRLQRWISHMQIHTILSRLQEEKCQVKRHFVNFIQTVTILENVVYCFSLDVFE